MLKYRRIRYLKTISGRNFDLDLIQHPLIYFTLETIDSSNSNNEVKSFYISEQLSDTLNPDWLQLDNIPKENLIQENFKIKIWSNNGIIYEEIIYLSKLQFICKNLKELKINFPNQSILFELLDGIYATSKIVDKISAIYKVCLPNKKIETNSNENLLKIIDFTFSCKKLRELKQEQEEMMGNIEEKFSNEREIVSKINYLQEQHIEKKRLKKILKFKRQLLEQEKKRFEEKKKDITKRTSNLIKGLESLKESKQNLVIEEQKLRNMFKEHQKLISCIKSRKETMLQDIQKIFPIEKLPDNNGYLIEKVEFLHINHNNNTDEKISTCLGFLAQILHILSLYLEVPLRYPIELKGSRSTICDEISSNIQTSFPLYLKNVSREKFLLSILFLNTNLKQIIFSQQITLNSLKESLENIMKFMTFKNSSKEDSNDNIKTRFD
ncbi:uv radiation resistance-associated protein [Anaeramoeba ignava]|uniref:Uv radiation resistance-associated protein n=1 Tax=Anaeramoeba ignava TaxID=1746090 RepID=A0A9Q0LUG6_ANAIG|nr:uv radiation resistance-associated protein [Anaeramoeba ignava]KAJ5078886.1 uv radiation resistance-associated protein [Anaeramoeba ignava]